mgnify:CR=1 FL=1
MWCKPMIPDHIFRAYDIRGIYGVDLTEEAASRIGRALSTYLNGEGKEIIVGRDVRLSGNALEGALIEGLLSGGCNIEDVGVVTTPILYFSTAHYGKDAGVMVTASHNPPEWNGFKIVTKRGFVCEGKGMETLKKIAIDGRFKYSTPGKLEKNTQILTNYMNYVLKSIHLERGLKGVFDPGNGSCSLLIPNLCEDAGVSVVALNSEPDGNFPAHPPEPTTEVLEELAKVVLKEKANFGAAFDGDGDRCLFVDDRGRIVSENAILIILAEHYLKEHEGASIVYEVSCSMGVEETIRSHRGKPVLSRVGHTYISEEMRHEKATFGGESSGHYYFAELYGFDDAVFASLKLAEILSKRDERFSDIVDSVPIYPIFSQNFDCPDEKKFNVVDALKEEFEETGHQILAIDGAKVIDSNGWFLIRPSNTQPQIRLTVEAKTKEDLEQLSEFAERKLLEKI